MLEDELTSPTIHIDGSDPRKMIQHIYLVLLSLSAAVERMGAIVPNARDYASQGKGAIAVAMRQHSERVAALDKVRADLLDITLEIQAQVRAQKLAAY